MFKDECLPEKTWAGLTIANNPFRGT